MSTGHVIQMKPILVLDDESGMLKSVESNDYTNGQLQTFLEKLNPADADQGPAHAALSRLLRNRSKKKKRVEEAVEGWTLERTPDRARKVARRRSDATERTFLEPTRSRAHADLAARLLAGLKSAEKPGPISFEGVTAQQAIRAQTEAFSSQFQEQGEDIDTVSGFPTWGLTKGGSASGERTGKPFQYIERGGSHFNQQRVPFPFNLGNLKATSIGDYGTKPEKKKGPPFALDITSTAQEKLGFDNEKELASALLDFGQSGVGFPATSPYSRPSPSLPLIPPSLAPSSSSSSSLLPSSLPSLLSPSSLPSSSPPPLPSVPSSAPPPSSSSSSSSSSRTSPEIEQAVLKLNALAHHFLVEEPFRFHVRGRENPRTAKGPRRTNRERRQPALTSSVWGLQSVASGVSSLPDILGKNAPKGPVTPKGISNKPEDFESRFFALFGDRQRIAAQDPAIRRDLLKGDETLIPRLTPVRQAIRKDLRRGGGGDSDSDDQTGYETEWEVEGEEEEEEEEEERVRGGPVSGIDPAGKGKEKS